MQQYLEEHYDDEIIVYPPELLSSLSSAIPEVRSIACKSLRWYQYVFLLISSHNGQKSNQDRVLVYSSDQFHAIILAVFDGHGKYGHCVASFIRHTFLINFSNKESCSAQYGVVSSLQEADTMLRTNPHVNSRLSGCTANIGCLYYDILGRLCYSSVFIGDSESVMCGEMISRSVMVVRKNNGSRIQLALSEIHNPSDPKEKERIERYKGYVKELKIHPAVPAVPRVFMDEQCTRGGLAMSRSIGDQLMHEFGVSSELAKKQVYLSDYPNTEILIVIGSDGLLGYMKKDKILACFPFESEPDLASALTRACEKSQAYQLKLSKQRYADDTSGIAVRLHVLSVCPITFQQTLQNYSRPSKKLFPLSSTNRKAGKSTTSIFQIASIPSSGYSKYSTFLIFSFANTAAGPPILPK